MAYTTVARVRTAIGIASGTISDADVTSLIADAEKEVDRLMNTTYEPKRVIEYIDEYTLNSGWILLRKYPVVHVNSITIDGTTVSPAHVKVYPAGRLYLSTSAEETMWEGTDPQDNIIEYRYADMEESTTESTLDGATVADATTLDVAAGDGSSFSADDYIKVFYTDGNEEIVKVTNVATDTLTVSPALRRAHADGSYVVKMQVPQLVVRLTDVTVALMMVARIVGESYTDIVGYSLEGLQVQKGEPYTQWRETATQLLKERESILRSMRPKPAVA